MVSQALRARGRRRPFGWEGRIAGLFAVLTIGIAFVGPLLAPYGPNNIVGVPFSPPSGSHLLGTDFVGRDVLSRLLYGGTSVVLLAGLATLIGYVVGAAIGLMAGYRGGLVDAAWMRIMDVLLSVPPLILLLVLATGAGPNEIALVLGIATIHVPGVARIIRTATSRTAVRGYVEAAVARGEGSVSVLRREVLPNITGVIAADAGPRFTVSILLVAAVNFLGLGIRPPAANWGLMISENNTGLSLNPWAVVAPAVLIAILTISVNVLGDALARARDQSIDVGTMRR
jgi:peptide/nickel transport system permease protein